MSQTKELSAQDYCEIQNLYARYNLCSDAGDAEGYAGCFTPDGELELEGLGIRVRGREAFIEFKRKDAAGRGGRYRRHWNGSLHLEKLDETTVRGRAYMHGFNGEPGSLPQLADVGIYDDTIVKGPEGWRFARRHLSFDAVSFKLKG